MKKYEKVNLTSQIYKQKTPTKSSLNLKPVQTSQHNSFNKSYHNVCCPSCRYLFKIPKDNDRVRTPTHANKGQTGHKGTGQKSQRTMEVQTEQYLLGNFRTSPKREKIREESSKRGMMTDRTPQKSPYFQQIKNRSKSPVFIDKSSEAGKQELLTSRKKQTGSIRNQKISNLIKQTTLQKFPARSAYTKSNAQTSKIKQQKSPIRAGQQSSKPKPKTLPKQNIDEVTNNLIGELLKKIQLTEQINEIIQYQMNLPPEYSVPSYCKMLMYEMEERKDQEKNRNEGGYKDTGRDRNGNGNGNGEDNYWERMGQGDSYGQLGNGRDVNRRLNY